MNIDKISSASGIVAAIMMVAFIVYVCVIGVSESGVTEFWDKASHDAKLVSACVLVAGFLAAK